MRAVREIVGVEEMVGVKEMRWGQGTHSRPKFRPWPRLAREVVPVYQPDSPQGLPAPSTSVTSPGHLPLDPDDELFDLGERCAGAYMQADALQYQAMRLLVEFHRREGWRDTGFSSTAEWLAWRIGIRSGAARERVRTALALDELPQISEAMEGGALSFTKVRALTRVATPDTEGTLLDLAQAGSASNLERIVRGWKSLDRRSEVTAEQIRHRSRRFSAFVDVDGMVVVRGRLDPEVGALLMRAVDAANDALFREKAGSERGESASDHRATIDEPNTELQEMTPEQRRADAMGLIAERALAAGFGNRPRREGPGQGCSGRSGRSGSSQANADAPISGSRAERYQVILHVDESTLNEDIEPGQSELEDGTRVSAETSRRLSCDCGVVKIGHGPGGEIMGAGRRTRTVPPALRRALEARDRGCRFPGCGLRFTEAHHIVHWADGGETSLRNMALLCRTHHRAVHEGRVQICMDVGGQVAFFTPRGKVLFDAPKTKFLDPLETAEESAQEPSPRINPGPAHDSGAAKWKRDTDIPYEVEARAWEALDSG